MVCADKMGEVYGTYRGKRNAYSVFRGKPRGMRKLLRPRHRMRHNLKMNQRNREEGSISSTHKTTWWN